MNGPPFKKIVVLALIVWPALLACESTPPAPSATPTTVPIEPAARPTGAYPAAIPSPVALATVRVTLSPSPRRFNQILDMASVGAMNLWALGSYCDASGCAVALQRTTDGGRTWRLLAVPNAEPLFFPSGNVGPGVDSVRFDDVRNGWLFGSDFFTTHDGGLTWSQEARDKQIVGLDTARGSVWAVEQICAQPSVCNFDIVESIDQGRSWHQLSRPLTVQGRFGQLIRVDEQHALISYGVPIQQPCCSTEIRLASTDDAGATWHAMTDPCPMQYSLVSRLAALDSSNLWALCGGLPSAGQQPKSLYISADGGNHWNVSPQEVGWCGYVSDVALVSREKGFLALSRCGVEMTSNGGHTWTAMETGIRTDLSGQWRIRFSDGQHGWITNQSYIARTADGGATWEPLDLSTVN